VFRFFPLSYTGIINPWKTIQLHGCQRHGKELVTQNVLTRTAPAPIWAWKSRSVSFQKAHLNYDAALGLPLRR
jgi:hypothetical protein